MLLTFFFVMDGRPRKDGKYGLEWSKVPIGGKTPIFILHLLK